MFVEKEREIRVKKVLNGFIIITETKIPKEDDDYDWDTKTYVYQSVEDAEKAAIEYLKDIING